MKNIKWMVAVLVGFVVVGCAAQQNPAIVYCEEVGGEYVIKQDAGYCELPGRSVEAWELYKAKDRFDRPSFQ